MNKLTLYLQYQLKSQPTVRAVSDAFIHRVFAISGPPQYLSIDQDKAVTSSVIQLLLQSLQCNMQIISPWNHASSKAERQIQMIGNMITKQLQSTGNTWPLYASVAAYAMNTFASKVLQGFSPFELVFARKLRDLTSIQFKLFGSTSSPYVTSSCGVIPPWYALTARTLNYLFLEVEIV